MSNDPFAQFNLDLPKFSNAACASSTYEPDTWFPEALRDTQVRELQIQIAKSFCGQCVHQVDCLQFALDNSIGDGIWGGTLPEERASQSEQSKRFRGRQHKLDEIRRIMAKGISLEIALADVGLSEPTYLRYLHFEKAGWPKEISSKKRKRKESKC